VPFFGAFGAAWDDAMVARWSANPLGMLWPEMDAGFASSGGSGGSPPASSPAGLALSNIVTTVACMTASICNVTLQRRLEQERVVADSRAPQPEPPQGDFQQRPERSHAIDAGLGPQRDGHQKGHSSSG
jgi:hypothetical protein